MKRTLSAILAVFMIIMSVGSFSVSATANEPTIDAEESKVISASVVKMSASVNNAALFDGSYGDSLNPCEGMTAYGNTAAAQALGGCGFYETSTRYTAFSEKVADGHHVNTEAVYNCFFQFTLGSTGATAAEKTKVSSVMIVVPAATSKVGGCAPDGFTLYYGDILWMSSSDNEEAKINMNKMNYKYLCTVSGLVTENKYVAADGYRYYEVNLPQPIEAKYLLLLFSTEYDLASKLAKRGEGDPYTLTAYNYVMEFAAFENPIYGADVAGTTEHIHRDNIIISSSKSVYEVENDSDVTVTMNLGYCSGFAGLRLMQAFPNGFSTVDAVCNAAGLTMTKGTSLLFDSPSNYVTSGSLFDIKIHIDDSVTAGDYYLNIDTLECIDASLNDVTLTVSPIHIKVKEKNQEHQHSYNYFYSYNETSHWIECSTCLEKKDVASHVYSDNLDTTCNICSYIRTVTQPDNPEAMKIVVESKTAVCGNQFTIDVSIENNPGFVYLELTPDYSEPLSVVSVENGKLISDFEKGKQYIWISNDNVLTNGNLLSFTFTTSENATPGTYEVGFIARSCLNYDEKDVEVSIEKGTVTLIDFIYGDVNGDLAINGQDLVRLKKYLANYDYNTGISTYSIFAGADANGDNTINGQDAVRLKKYLANYDYNTGTSTIVLGAVK